MYEEGEKGVRLYPSVDLSSERYLLYLLANCYLQNPCWVALHDRLGGFPPNQHANIIKPIVSITAGMDNIAFNQATLNLGGIIVNFSIK